MRFLPAPADAHPGVVREAFVLPLAFLSVALLGGLRAGASRGDLLLLPPPLFALVLSTLLLGVLVRSGALDPTRLLHGGRDPLANVSGGVVLVSVWIAGAQLFNCLTPERGLLNFLFNLFYLALLWNTAAAAPDATRLWRSLQAVFGSAFILKYIVLAALYDPDGGLARRVLTTLLEGVTLGGLDYRPYAPLTGYVAFATVLTFMIGLLLLPHDREGTPPRQRLPARTDPVPDDSGSSRELESRGT